MRACILRHEARYVQSLTQAAVPAGREETHLENAPRSRTRGCVSLLGRGDSLADSVQIFSGGFP